ncbi:MAG: [acyl-carrier-protein] S-malonyltransferase [Candidatus Latescibacterota bacterium]
MSDFAYIFPGQASQAVGMAADLYAAHEGVRTLFARADEVLGFALSDLCFNGPEEQLAQTAVTQPAVFVHSVAAFQLLEEQGLQPAVVAGHSLGEYSALVAAGALDFEVALQLVKDRSRSMQEAGEAQPGAMAALIGLGDAEVVALCERAVDAGTVVAANFNAPGQVVVSGEKSAVARLGELAREAGVKRFIELAVSGAFHSPLMQPTAEHMQALLEAAPISVPRVPVITNVSATAVKDPEVLRGDLIKQITHSVRWTESMGALVEMGLARAVEVGPGAVLKGLMKRIARDVKILGAGTVSDITATAAVLKGES